MAEISAKELWFGVFNELVDKEVYFFGEVNRISRLINEKKATPPDVSAYQFYAGALHGISTATGIMREWKEEATGISPVGETKGGHIRS